MLGAAAANTAPSVLGFQDKAQPWQFWLARPTSGPNQFPSGWRPPHILNGAPTRNKSTLPTPTLQDAAKLTTTTPVPDQNDTTPVAPVQTGGLRTPLFTVGGVTVTQGMGLALAGVAVLLWVVAKRRK